METVTIIIIVVVVILIAALFIHYVYTTTSSFIMKRLFSPDNPVNLANPASVYCAMQGFKTVIKDTPNGQVGYCVFKDGTACEEWSFYRGQCP